MILNIYDDLSISGTSYIFSYEDTSELLNFENSSISDDKANITVRDIEKVKQSLNFKVWIE